MAETLHPAAVDHLPVFITAPGQTDVLFNVMIVFVLVLVFLVGIFYLRLHALPEHMAHGASKAQLQIIGVLALIALFTHNHLFWIAALILAMIEFPDFASPIRSMARSLARIARREDRADERAPLPSGETISEPPPAVPPPEAPRGEGPEWVPLEVAQGDDKIERRR
ncbi:MULTISPECIES: hypothetical protein [unclassified Sinorhizobium]|uniref:hypothetical protein n=1 Tax=unclassified Sinorhizobium TaxID=2613772 RepID=UPI0024C2A4AA|nr:MULTISPECIES: hypothetical protein [unclassified Sinorhizobium]MDK1373311.1 hypothetical protein [Sinorhizobium sp. 6-70]MDK1481801.1 hypothetical protein [Sinorhizobium sp. 6-117]